MTTVVLVFIAGALVAALSGVIGEEARGWLELAPRGILRLVAMRLPGDQRKTVYEKEWLPELLAILQEADGRPITRLFVGIRFAASMARGAGDVARELDGVRKDEPETVIHVRDADEGELLDGRYENVYGPTFSGAGSLTAAAQVVVEGTSDAEAIKRVFPGGGAYAVRPQRL